MSRAQARIVGCSCRPFWRTMSNPYYVAGEARADRVHKLFSSIARRYNLMNDLQSFGLHRWWKRRLVRMARIQPGERVLDLCCGTGDLALASAERGASVVGVDFSDPMLAVARSREQRRNRGAGAEANPEFLLADATRTPLSDSSFDVVMMGYGLRNLSDFKEGLREMRRLAKPGGRLLVLDFGKPAGRLWRALYFGYLRAILPVMGWLVCGDAAAYGYILVSLKEYPAQEGVALAMRELGLSKVGVVNLLGGVMSIHYAEKTRLVEG